MQHEKLISLLFNILFDVVIDIQKIDVEKIICTGSTSIIMVNVSSCGKLLFVQHSETVCVTEQHSKMIATTQPDLEPVLIQWVT